MSVMNRKRIFTHCALALTLVFALVMNMISQGEPILPAVSANTPTRYEAETATRSGNASVTNSSSASGGQYVEMRDGNLTFTVNVPIAGFYTVWARYSNTYGGSKTQNLVINGSASGGFTFPSTGTSLKFESIKMMSKIKLNAGNNTIAITNSWGWVDIDYIEIETFVAEPFNLSSVPVNPKATANTKKMYSFLLENFQNKIISGVMTNEVTNGNTPLATIETQKEVAHIKLASGKTPALVGFDFMHGTGLNSDGVWYKAYNNGTLALAEDLYKKGGIPIFAWHWKDPGLAAEDFTSNANFDANSVFNTSSSGYNAIIRDIDIVAGYLKQLADKDIPVLWRPLHEAAGQWFWWGAKGAEANKQLWIVMYNRLVNHHNLNNLIWVWTCEEKDALDWYPGDQYVDIVGRDFYYYPAQKNHGSLTASFENIKDIYSGRKMIALAENGSIPYPSNLIEDGAGWSWFMPWYGEWTGLNGNTTHNLASDWNLVMNHSYVITLEDMVGWGNYNPGNPPTTTPPVTTTTPPVITDHGAGGVISSPTNTETSGAHVINGNATRTSTSGGNTTTSSVLDIDVLSLIADTCVNASNVRGIEAEIWSENGSGSGNTRMLYFAVNGTESPMFHTETTDPTRINMPRQAVHDVTWSFNAAQLATITSSSFTIRIRSSNAFWGVGPIKLLDKDGNVLGISTYSTRNANGTWSGFITNCVHMPVVTTTTSLSTTTPPATTTTPTPTTTTPTPTTTTPTPTTTTPTPTTTTPTPTTTTPTPTTTTPTPTTTTLTPTTTTPTPTTTTPAPTTTTPTPTTTTPTPTTTTPTPTTTTPTPTTTTISTTTTTTPTTTAATTTTAPPTTTPSVTTEPPVTDCGNCGKCDICVPFKLGHVCGNDTIGISDALEVLMFLAKIDTALIIQGGEGSRPWKAACITPISKKNNRPSINDALQIIMYLVYMPSELGIKK